jgi:hypothetical protein
LVFGCTAIIDNASGGDIYERKALIQILIGHWIFIDNKKGT